MEKNKKKVFRSFKNIEDFQNFYGIFFASIYRKFIPLIKGES